MDMTPTSLLSLVLPSTFSSISIHTSYLPFVLHGQDLLVIFCSTQKRVNRDKMDFASKQRESQQNGTHCKFVTWTKIW